MKTFTPVSCFALAEGPAQPLTIAPAETKAHVGPPQTVEGAVSDVSTVRAGGIRWASGNKELMTPSAHPASSFRTVR